MNFSYYLQNERIMVFWYIVLGYALMYLTALVLAWIVYTFTKNHRHWTVERIVFNMYAMALCMHLTFATYFAYTNTLAFWHEGRWDFMLWSVPYWAVVIFDFIFVLILWKKGSNSYFTSTNRRQQAVDSEMA